MIENLLGGGGGGGTVDTIQAGTGISVDSTNPASPIITNTSLNTDQTAKVSSNDTTAGFLNGKLVAGTGITFTENNNGANETLTIASSVTDTNDAAKVSSNDTTAGFLNGKLVAGTNITFTENNNGGNETLTIAAAGGVTGFTGSQNTSSPNNTVNASRLLVDATSTNADFVAQPKGTGALLAQLPDSAATGGNKRGPNAVDLQTARGTASQVASGEKSVALGSNNTASNLYSVAIGNGNQSTNIYSFAIGTSCRATEVGSIALGTSSLCDTPYAIAFSSGNLTAIGDSGLELHHARIETTNATQTNLEIGGGNTIKIKSDSTYSFSALVTARRTDADNEGAGYKLEGVIDNNAGTTALIGTVTKTVLAEDTAAWDVVAEADNTNDALVIKVTGEAAKTIKWAAIVTMVKVTG